MTAELMILYLLISNFFQYYVHHIRAEICKFFKWLADVRKGIIERKKVMIRHFVNVIWLSVAAKQEGSPANWTNDPVQNAVVCSVDASQAR